MAALLSGCSSPKTRPPEKPGTSIQLSYPVLLIGTEAPLLTVIDAELALTTTTKSSSLFYAADRIVDSGGSLYAIKKVTPVGEVHSAWRDMGTSQYQVFVDVKFLKRVDVEQARKLVLNVVRSPRSDLSHPPEQLSKVVKRVESYGTLNELIFGCRDTLDWTH